MLTVSTKTKNHHPPATTTRSPIPPSKRPSSFKLYKRRQSSLKRLKINPLVPGLFHPAASGSPRSPCLLDFPSLSLSSPSPPSSQAPPSPMPPPPPRTAPSLRRASSSTLPSATLTRPTSARFFFAHTDACDGSLVGWGHHMICNRMLHFVLLSRKDVPAKEGRGMNVHGHCGVGEVKALLTTKLQSKLMHGVLSLAICSASTASRADWRSFPGIRSWSSGTGFCSGLQPRKVNLIDIGRKGTMSLRLIHGIAYGEPWFGTWAYHFVDSSSLVLVW